MLPLRFSLALPDLMLDGPSFLDGDPAGRSSVSVCGQRSECECESAKPRSKHNVPPS